MRFKNIRTYFLMALAVATVLRAFQFFYTLDPVTGFIRPAYKTIGFGLVSLVFLIAASVFGVCLTVQRCPVKLPKINLFTGCSALFAAVTVLYDLAFIGASANIPAWQPMLLKITGALTAVFFGALFIKSIKNFKIPAICFAVPVIYYLARLIYLFTASSTLSLVSDNLFILSAEIFIVLFMFEFCLVANQLDRDKSYKKIAATGYTAVVLCSASAIPQLLAFLFAPKLTQRVDISVSLVTFSTGLFIYCFLRRHFSGRNLKSRRKHHHLHTQFMRGSSGNDFYMG